MRGVIIFFALLKMTASRCLSSWSAANQRSTPEALAEGLKSRILSLLVSLYPSWAPTRDAPTGAVLCYLYSVLFLGTHKGCPYGVVLFRADTPVPPLRHLYSVLFLGTHEGCPYRCCTLLSVLCTLLGLLLASFGLNSFRAKHTAHNNILRANVNIII